MNTLVVNCFAGPGAGKTTCAWSVAAELKKKGINCEYVPEYPKELVWEGNYAALNDQEHLFEVAKHRLSRLRGKVEVIVTDAPLLLNHIYGKNNSEQFTQAIDDEYNRYYNFNLFVKRGEDYEQAGRIQNLDESIEIDKKILDMLRTKELYFGTYSHENIKYIADNIIRNLRKIRALPDKNVGETLSDAAAYEPLYGKEEHRGYYITNRITINQESYVLGYNPTAQEQYVTWKRDRNGEYDWGHYFSTEKEAKEDLYSRALDQDKEIISGIFVNARDAEMSEMTDDFDMEM